MPPVEISEMQGVSVRNISRRFGETLALNDVSLDFALGSVVGLVGKNGAGKSTLMNILSGVVQPTNGEILVDGQKVTLPSARQAVDAGIIAVHQDLDIFPRLSVAENICLSSGTIPKKGPFVSTKGMRERASGVIDRVGIEINTAAFAGSLSVSNQRMVTIARGLLDRPGKMVILDEPTESLTGREVERLFELIESWRNDLLAVVYVSHRLEEILTVADRIVALRAGEVVLDENRELLSREALVEAMTGTKLKERKKALSDTEELQKNDEILADSAEVAFDDQIAGGKNPVLDIKNLHTKLKLKDINLSVQPGEIIGIAGLIGSGRTTLARVLGGLELPESGSIFIDGQKIDLQNPRDSHRAGIWYVPADRKELSLFPVFQVWEDIGIPILEKFKNLLNVFSSNLGIKHAKGEINRIEVEPPNPKLRTQILSGGNQQKVVLSRAFQQKMKLLVLDEPTQGVDVETRESISEMLTDLTTSGVSILVISSDFQELITLSSRIIVLADGLLLEEVDPQNETESSLLNIASSATS